MKKDLFIDESRKEEVLKWIQAEKARWTGEEQDCENCGESAKVYEVFNAGTWQREFICLRCGFDSWAQKTEDFNNDMAWIGSV